MADNDKPTDVAQQHTMQEAAQAAALAKWEGDFPEEDLNVPYKREAEEAKPTEPEEKPAPPKKDDDVDAEYEAPAPVVTIQDPGDYQPADYSFEVILKDGKSVKISSPEEAEKLADDPDNFETPKQLLDFIKKSTQMQNKLDKDYEKWEFSKKTYEEQSAIEQERIDTINNIANGFDYLVSKGLLPAVDKQYLDADWSDPEIAKQDGVKEQIALLNYMVKENKAREKAGIPPLTSAVDLYNAYQLDTGRKQEEVEHKAAGEARRAAGARVAGVSPAQQGSYIPKGIAVGRVLPQRGAAMWDD